MIIISFIIIGLKQPRADSRFLLLLENVEQYFLRRKEQFSGSFSQCMLGIGGACFLETNYSFNETLGAETS